MYKGKKDTNRWTNISVYRVAAQLKSLLAALAITCLAEGLSWPMTGFLYLDKYNLYKVLKTWDNFSRDNHSTIKVNIILFNNEADKFTILRNWKRCAKSRQSGDGISNIFPFVLRSFASYFGNINLNLIFHYCRLLKSHV